MAVWCVLVLILVLAVDKIRSQLTITGVWTADNAAEYFVNGVSITKKSAQWESVRQLTPVTVQEDYAIVQFAVRNSESSGGWAALFVNLVVNDQPYSRTGDGNWLVANTTQNASISNSPRNYPFTALTCDGKPHVWEIRLANFTQRLTINGLEAEPIWVTSDCFAKNETRTFSLAVSSFLPASDAKRFWQNGTLYNQTRNVAFTSILVNSSIVSTPEQSFTVPTTPTVALLETLVNTTTSTLFSGETLFLSQTMTEIPSPTLVANESQSSESAKTRPTETILQTASARFTGTESLSTVSLTDGATSSNITSSSNDWKSSTLNTLVQPTGTVQNTTIASSTNTIVPQVSSVLSDWKSSTGLVQSTTPSFMAYIISSQAVSSWRTSSSVSETREIVRSSTTTSGLRMTPSPVSSSLGRSTFNINTRGTSTSSTTRTLTTTRTTTQPSSTSLRSSTSSVRLVSKSTIEESLYYFTDETKTDEATQITTTQATESIEAVDSEASKSGRENAKPISVDLYLSVTMGIIILAFVSGVTLMIIRAQNRAKQARMETTDYMVTSNLGLMNSNTIPTFYTRYAYTNHLTDYGA